MTDREYRVRIGQERDKFGPLGNIDKRVGGLRAADGRNWRDLLGQPKRKGAVPATKVGVRYGLASFYLNRTIVLGPKGV